MGKTEKNAIMNNFIFSNFNYYPLAWHFRFCQFSEKIKSIQKCCLVLNDHENNYATLLKKNNTNTIEIEIMLIQIS